MKLLKTVTAVAIALLMLLSLSACDMIKDVLTKLPNQNGDMWYAAYAVVDGERYEVDELFEGSVTVELMRNGKSVINVKNLTRKGAWSCVAGVITITGFTTDTVGTMEPDVMRLQNFLDTGVELVFTRDGTAPDMTLAPYPTEDIDPTDDIDPTEAPVERQQILGLYTLHEAEIDGVYMDYDALVEEELIEGSYILFDEECWGEFSFSDLTYDSFSYDEINFLLYLDEDAVLPFEWSGDFVTLELPGFGAKLVFKYDPDFTFGYTLPGNWYGWINYTNCTGDDMPEGYEAVRALIYPNEDGRWFFEVYEDGYAEGDSPLISMWIDGTDIESGTTILPDIGSEDAWVLDTFITEEYAPAFRKTIASDGSLSFCFEYLRYDGSASCTVKIFLRPESAAWFENDILPPGYGD